jgi:hypothetical protein
MGPVDNLGNNGTNGTNSGLQPGCLGTEVKALGIQYRNQTRVLTGRVL